MAYAMVKCSAGDAEWGSRELYSQMCEERDYMVNAIKNNVVKMSKESQAKKRAMIEGYFFNTRAGIHSGRWAPIVFISIICCLCHFSSSASAQTTNVEMKAILESQNCCERSANGVWKGWENLWAVAGLKYARPGMLWSVTSIFCT